MSQNVSATTEIDESQTLETQKPVHKFKSSPIYLLIDISIRIILYFLVYFGVIEDWLFWIIQVFVINPGMLLIIYVSHWRKTKKIRAKYPIEDNELIMPVANGWMFLLAFTNIIIQTIITFSLYPNWHIIFRIILSLVVCLFYSIITFVWGVGSLSSKPKNSDQYQNAQFIKPYNISYTNIENVLNTLPVENHIQEKETKLSITERINLVIDINDIEIIEMQTKLNSAKQSVDTYTLESALFGGLAFSGFVSLLSSDLPVILFTQNFFENLSIVFSSTPKTWISQLPLINNQETLIGLILIETIICSMLFLSVIVSRIKFNDTIKDADFLINTANAYNDKEEEIFQLIIDSEPSHHERLTKRYYLLNEKSKDAINTATPLFDIIDSIINYMKVFRSLGLAMFVVLLASSALLVSEILSVIFIILYILSYSYISLDKFARTQKIGEKIKLFKTYEKNS